MMERYEEESEILNESNHKNPEIKYEKLVVKPVSSEKVVNEETKVSNIWSKVLNSSSRNLNHKASNI
jgi:hypothetical protein